MFSCFNLKCLCSILNNTNTHKQTGTHVWERTEKKKGYRKDSVGGGISSFKSMCLVLMLLLNCKSDKWQGINTPEGHNKKRVSRKKKGLFIRHSIIINDTWINILKMKIKKRKKKNLLEISD